MTDAPETDNHRTIEKLAAPLRRIALEFVRARRRLLREPMFAINVVALLALGIGGSAAVGSAAYDLLLRPLPYADAERLATVSVFANRMSIRMGVSAPLVEELADSEAFAGIGIIESEDVLPLKSGDVRASRLDHRAVDVLGLPPVIGRTFEAADTRNGAEPVALIAESLWNDRFGGDPDVLGRDLELADGERLRIVGVLPRGFDLPDGETRVWRPIDLGSEALDPSRIASFGNATVIARLPEGDTAERAEQRLRARLGDDPRLQALAAMLEAEYRVRPLRERWSEGRSEGLAILGGALALLLVASLFNIAGLWMARWFGRSRELAVQAALGGGRGTTITGALAEYVWLFVPAAALGVLVALGAIELFYRLDVLGEAGPLTTRLSGITVLLALVLAIAGAVPVVAALGWQMRTIGRSGMRYLGGGGSATRAHGAALRRWLMVGQIAIAFSLVTVFWLLFSSWNKLLDQDLGFSPERLIAARIAIPAGRYPASSLEADPTVQALLDRLRAVPSVESASWSNAVPFGGIEMIGEARLDAGDEQALAVRPREVGTGYFDTAGIAVVRGRAFAPSDDEAGRVIVDRLFAERHFGGDALGRSVWLGSEDNRRAAEIIGVVDTVRHMQLDRNVPTPTLYTYSAAPPQQAQLLLRTAVDPASLLETVRETIEGEVGPDRIGSIVAIEEAVRRAVRDREPQLVLMGIFAGLALVLVFYGLYALQSYQVAARTPELGLRMAMGASGTRVVGEIVRSALRLMLPGLVLGAIGGWAGARLVETRLFETPVVSPLAWLLVGASLSCVVAAAALVPGLRAFRISPMEALRDE